MPCYHPLQGYVSKRVNENGKREIKFSRSAGFSDLAYTVPCGKCIGCRVDRSRAWALRCTHEAKMHSANCFVTLTYSDDNLPADGGLVVSDLQKFFKRLRKAGYVFRYYACGEYGDNTRRPHYHAILFGIDFSADRRQHSKTSRGDIVYISDTLLKIWGLGHCLIGSFNYACAAYVARYCMKKSSPVDGSPHSSYQRINLITGETVSVCPEFAVMSRRPGIGSSWYEKYKCDAFPSDFLVVDGKKHPVPSFYLRRLEKENSATHKKVKLKRIVESKNNADNLTMVRLRVRETVKESQLSQLKREI